MKWWHVALPIAETLFPTVSKPGNPKERTVVPDILSSHWTNTSVISFKVALTGVSCGTCSCAVGWKKLMTFFWMPSCPDSICEVAGNLEHMEFNFQSWIWVWEVQIVWTALKKPISQEVFGFELEGFQWQLGRLLELTGTAVFAYLKFWCWTV